MAVDIPSEVALFLNLCGIPYPDINEDDVRALAGHVRTFAAQVQDTHDSATGVIEQLGAFYSGESYQQLVATWARMSSTHMRQLESACEIVGQALEVAATVITMVKVAVLAELAALAASYTAIMLTPPLAPSAPLVAAAARRLCEQMLQYLVGYIVAEVIGKAIEPLEQAIADMVDGIVYDAARDALDVPPSSGTRALHIDSNEVQRFAKVLDDHADDIMQHAANFAENVAKLDFTTASRFDGTYPAAADTTATGVRPPVGPAAPTAESSLRPPGTSESRFGPNVPMGPSGIAADSTHDARVPVRANAVDTGEKQADRSGNAADSSARGGIAEPSVPQVGAEHRSSISEPARSAPLSGAVPNSPDLGAAERSAGLGTPRPVSAHAAYEAGTVAARDAALTPSVGPAYDAEAHRPGAALDSPSAAGHLPVDGSVSGAPPGVATLAQQSPGVAGTPWGRVGGQPAPRSPLPLEAADRPAKSPPKVPRPAVTPWSKARRARDVPGAVHAPSAGRPPVHVIREKEAEAGGAENAGLADAKAPSGVTAPPSDRMHPPGARGQIQ